jgi:hypothetical protein
MLVQRDMAQRRAAERAAETPLSHTHTHTHALQGTHIQYVHDTTPALLFSLPTNARTVVMRGMPIAVSTILFLRLRGCNCSSGDGDGGGSSDGCSGCIGRVRVTQGPKTAHVRPAPEIGRTTLVHGARCICPHPSLSSNLKHVDLVSPFKWVFVGKKVRVANGHSQKIRRRGGRVGRRGQPRLKPKHAPACNGEMTSRWW